MWFDTTLNQIYLYGGDIGKLNKKKLARFKNNVQFINNFNIKTQDALNRYHLEGLPDTVSERVVLQSLLWYGCVCFFERDGSLLALPCAPSGEGVNIYGDPVSVWVFSKNGTLNKQVPVYVHGSDVDAFLSRGNGYRAKGKPYGVCVWENASRYPFINQTLFYSEAVSDSMRTLDVCRANIKNPYIVTAEESMVNTVKEYFNKRDNNEEFIISSGIFPADKVKVLPLVANSESLSAITALIEWYESKYRELCGVDNNAQMDKKGENLIQAEVSINDEYTDQGIKKIIPYIQDGLDDVNKIFGTEISVHANYDDSAKENRVQKNDGGDE